VAKAWNASRSTGTRLPPSAQAYANTNMWAMSGCTSSKLGELMLSASTGGDASEARSDCAQSRPLTPAHS